MKYLLRALDVVIITVGLYGIATAKDSHETSAICIIMLLSLKGFKNWS